MEWLVTAIFLHFILNIISYGLYLNIIVAVAQNKVVSYGFIYLFKVKHYYLVAFFILDSFNNGFEQFAVPIQAGHRFFSSFQRGYYFLQIVRIQFCSLLIPLRCIKIKNLFPLYHMLPKEAMLIKLDSTESTNNYAMQLLDSGAPMHGVVVTAASQSSGKGQRGRKWDDTPGESVLMSVIIQPQLPLEQQFLLNTHVVTAIANVLQNLYAEWKINVKWPNDIIVDDKKAGGVLIENVLRGAYWAQSVIGFGLNVRQQQMTNLPFATSLYLASGISYDVYGLIRQFAEAMLSPPDFASSQKRYNELLWMRGTKRQFLDADGKEMMAEIIEVQPEGTIMLEDDRHGRRTWRHGEVTWLYQ
jgi:BirA family transcriptional regulator, biotin operon repressor / biotin---[acetyl-CoA-carboxylase] ligase